MVFSIPHANPITQPMSVALSASRSVLPTPLRYSPLYFDQSLAMSLPSCTNLFMGDHPLYKDYLLNYSLRGWMEIASAMRELKSSTVMVERTLLMSSFSTVLPLRSETPMLTFSARTSSEN